ncbi:MAG: flagellar hook-associated protein FlgK [Nitriliruptoraceae bacterium]
MGFVGLYTGLSGIRAAQAGLDVSSHNIANANTPGYTRQRVELRASQPYRSAAGWIGTGTTVDDISRLRDQFLDDRYRSAIGEASQQGVRAEFLTSMEDLTNEPDNGLSGRIERLWDAAETWSNNPADAASRRQVLTELSSIADGFQSTTAAWDRLGEDYTERRDTVVSSANQLLTDLHDLNARMTGADAHRIGPDLNDQRDEMLDELAEMLGTVARPSPDGGVSITLNGVELLGPDVDTTAPSVAIDGDGNVVVTDAEAGTETLTYDQITGELGGLQEVLQEDLPTWRGQLDVLASGLADAVNDLNTGAGTAWEDPARALLGFGDPTEPAATLSVLTDDVDALVASAAGPAGSVHDGSNARAIADLRTTEVGFTDGGGTTSRRIGDQLADLTIGLAGAVRSARSAAEGATGVATGAHQGRAAEHGVSVDEEMVGLVRYQRALEANARVMTTVDQTLDVLVNRVGIVGR